MITSFSGWMFVLTGILMGYFSRTIYVAYKKNPSNTINRYYVRASAVITIAFFLYGFPSIVFGNRYYALVFFGEVATVLMMLGFGNFLMVPVYSWFSARSRMLIQYLIYFYTLAIAYVNILRPQESIVDERGIIHWRFHESVYIPVLLLIFLACSLNVALLARYFKRLSSFSLINTIMLIAAYVLAGASASYLYFGDSPTLLVFAAVALFVGVWLTFLSTIKSKVGMEKLYHTKRRK